MEYGDYEISCDKARLDIAMIHDYLANQSYWAKGISRLDVSRSIENSLCFGLYDGPEMAGFARVVTDYTRFAYLMDVFIREDLRSQGLGRHLIDQIINFETLSTVNWLLATQDAAGFYQKLGFTLATESGTYLRLARR